MPTYTFTQSFEHGTNVLTGTFSVTSAASLAFDAFVLHGMDVTLPGALTIASVKSVFMLATQDMTIRINGVNEVQELTPTGTITGGSFTLTYGTATTTALPYDAPDMAIALALEALAPIGPGAVVVSGGPAHQWPIRITFRGPLAATNVAQLSLTSNLTGGGSIGVSTVTQGVAAAQTITLPANAPILWADGFTVGPNPLTHDWAHILVSNDAGAPGNLYVRVQY